MSEGRLPPAWTAPLAIRWRDVSGDGPVDRLAAQVSDAERAQALRRVRPVLQQRHLAAHAWLRTCLADVTGVAPAALAFDAGPFGKPALRAPAPCAFNLSHSDHLVVVATATAPPGQPLPDVGVDVEALVPMADAEALAAHHFTPAEQAALAAAPPADRTRRFLLGWTRKEACMKAAGCGLQVEPHTLDTGLVTDARDTPFQAPQGLVTARVTSCVVDGRMVVSWAWLL